MSDPMLLTRSQPGRCRYCLRSMWVEYEDKESIHYECHCGSVSRAWKVKPKEESDVEHRVDQERP